MIVSEPKDVSLTEAMSVPLNQGLFHQKIEPLIYLVVTYMYVAIKVT